MFIITTLNNDLNYFLTPIVINGNDSVNLLAGGNVDYTDFTVPSGKTIIAIVGYSTGAVAVTPSIVGLTSNGLGARMRLYNGASFSQTAWPALVCLVK